MRLSHPQPHVQQTSAATPSHMHGGEYCRHSKAMLAAIDKAHLRHVHQRLETPVPVLHALPAAGKGREGRRCQSTTQTCMQCMPSHPCIHPPTPPFACAPGCIACKVLEKERALVLVDIHGHPGQPAASDRGLTGSSSESPPLRHGQMAIPPCMQQSKKWRRIRQFPTCCPAGLSAVHPCPPGRRGRR